MARAFRASGDSRIQAVKPKPADDLWAQLDALCIESGMPQFIEQPAGSFTAAQYARRCGLHASSASVRMRKLFSQGKIEYLGKGANNEKYYRIKK